MLNDREFSLLAYLKQNCNRGYTLISANSIVEYFKPEGVIAEQIGQTVIGLDEKGYLELKYFDGEEFLLRLLPPCFSVKKREEKSTEITPQQVTLPPLTKKDKTKILFLAFFGGFLGALISGLIGALLC